MRIIFFGTSEFAIPGLRAILGSRRHEVALLVTQPDRKRGRNLVLSQPAAKVLALAEDIPVYQPQDASGPDSIEYLKRFNADLFVVVSFGQILKEGVLAIPKLFSMNLHSSLLPKYRGAAPTNWAIINSDRTTGITIIRMNERMDEGDIILKKALDIDCDDTNITLSETLSELGAKALTEAIDRIAAGERLDFERQDNSEATYAPKLKKEDGLIDWSRDAAKIRDRVRGLIPWPGAYTCYEGKLLKILTAGVVDPASEKGAGCGEVIDLAGDKGIIVNTGRGILAIQRLQLEGKKAMDAPAFLRGHRVAKGYQFKESAF